MKINSQHYEAWDMNLGSKLAETAETLQEMKDKIDESNRRAEALGYKASQRLIVRVEYSREMDGERFIRATREEEAVEIYPSDSPKETWTYDDGGRSQYFKAERVGDCATRAIAIGTGKDYKEVYDAINKFAKKEKVTSRKHGISNARNGVYMETFKAYLLSLGWKWHPTMEIGSGCKVHLNADELPKGKVIVRLSKHYTCMIDGVIHDTYDCSRGGTRCVYGYFTKD